MTKPDNVSLAEIMFNAYGTSAGWVAVNGNLIPNWQSVGADVRAHWTRAAAAARAALSNVSRETSTEGGPDGP